MALRILRLQGFQPWLSAIWQRRKNEFLLVFSFLAALLLVWPAGNFPLNDDWTYGRSVMLLDQTGEVVLGTSSATLITQLYWGLLFVKIFGFSFTVLRIATWVVVIIFIVLFYQLGRRITGDGAVSSMLVLAMLFNPVFFSLGSTFMTDVYFCTAMVACFLSAHCFWERQRTRYFIAFAVSAILLVFIRQLGVMAPFIFFITSFFLRQRRWFWVAMSAVLFGFCCFLLWYFEKSLDAVDTHYQSPVEFGAFDLQFRDWLTENIKGRYAALAANTCVWTAPLLILYLKPFSKRAGLGAACFIVALAVFVSWLVFDRNAFPMGNIFANTTVGAETFYESLKLDRAPRPHTYSQVFAGVAGVLAFVAEVVTFSVLLLAFYLLVSGKAPLREKQLFVFSLLFACGYMVALMVPVTFFDRYLLPLPIALVLIAASVHPGGRIAVWPGIILLVPMIYVSVAGTGDYFRMHRLKWEANEHLRRDLAIPMERINGGHEINCWHEGQEFVSWDNIFIEHHNYLIQYNNVPGFRLYREYPFRRFFPPKNDKIYIFERIEKIKEPS